MSSELDKLIAESEAAIKRLDELQQRKQSTPFLQRIGRHLHKNSPYLINVLLAGSVLAVALGRLVQKQEHKVRAQGFGSCALGGGCAVPNVSFVGCQVKSPRGCTVQTEKEAWEQEQRRMQANVERADQRAAAVLSSTEDLVQRLEEAAQGKGARDLPAFVRQQVSHWRQQTAPHAEQLASSPAASAAASGTDSSSSSGSRIMV